MKNLAILLRIILACSFIFALHPALAQDDTALIADREWYRQTLIDTVDLWNGGLDGRSGMGTYRDDFDGFFHVNLNREWQQMPMWASSSIAQSRAIFINVQAYRAAGPDEGERFLKAINQGIDTLLADFWDDKYGGFYWMVAPSGQIIDDMKQGYGNVHPVLALAEAYSVTGNPAYLDAALDQLEVIERYFFDADYPGGILPGFSRDFTEIRGVKNVDVFTHLFEILLALYDVTEGEQQDHIADLIDLHGNFLVEHLYHDQDGYTDRGYVAYNYDQDWNPSQIPYSREMQWNGALHATTGHNIELAFLLSRAVERGFDPAWLNTADNLLVFCDAYAMHPEYGGMIYDTTDYAGKPLKGNPDNDFFIWWAQAETARAQLHFALVRGRQDYGDHFKVTEALIHDYLTDAEYGGWYQSLDAKNNLAPVGLDKGNIWKVAYHYTMFFTEVLRLTE